MPERLTLAQYLDEWAGSAANRRATADTVAALAASAAAISDLIAMGNLAGAMGEAIGENTGGDKQAALDVRAETIVVDALRDAPVAVVGSEESDEAILLDPSGTLAVAVDPLDGSSNIDTNVSIGTIFAVLPVQPNAAGEEDLAAALLQPGSRQVAAGFAIYGPQTVLALTLGSGAHVFTLDPHGGQFIQTGTDVKIPTGRKEYAINASNYRFWDPAVQAYIDHCIAGAEGPRGENFNMRWIASLVAEAYRVLQRGGIFLYPRDSRPGYEQGRLRLVYEANPIAFVIEQAGGGATDGISRILNLAPSTLHQRTPLVFGSRDKVDLVGRYHTDPPATGEFSPLFGRRGLFRV